MTKANSDLNKKITDKSTGHGIGGIGFNDTLGAFIEIDGTNFSFPYGVSNSDLETLSDFKILTVLPNYNAINSGYACSGIAYKLGKYVIVKCSFGGAHMNEHYLFVVSSEYLPKQKTLGMIRCRRSTTEGNGFNDFISNGVIEIDTDGKIWQAFNNEGFATTWTGDIFVCYEIA